jgi:predicted NBD/HSP70 family sugar kinase
MNPQVIVIGGSIAQAGEHIIAGAREVVYARSMPLATESLHIVQSRTGADAAIVGAALLALDHALSFANVERMILENAPRVPGTVRG